MDFSDTKNTQHRSCLLLASSSSCYYTEEEESANLIDQPVFNAARPKKKNRKTNAETLKKVDALTPRLLHTPTDRHCFRHGALNRPFNALKKMSRSEQALRTLTNVNLDSIVFNS